MLTGRRLRRRGATTGAALASFIAATSPGAFAQSASAAPARPAPSEAAPEGEQVTTVKVRAREDLESQAPPTPPAEPGPTRPSLTPVEAAPAPPPAPALEPEPNRLPAFLSLGFGGLMAGGALATGLIAKAKYDDAENTCSHTCRSDQLSDSRTFALTSTVLTGAAALGVGLGVVLLLAIPEGESEIGRLAPRWDVAVSPHATAASAAWEF